MAELRLLLFRKWEWDKVEVKDSGLKNAIGLKNLIVPWSAGRHEHKRFGKADVNIVERLADWCMHFGPKFAKNTGRMGGKKQKAIKIVKTAFEIIHLRTGQNPIQVLVRAIENAAPNEDTTRITYGGVVYHVAVDVSPIRRVDLALRFIADGAREAAFSTPKSIEEAIADGVILASNADPNSYAMKKKHELERVALASR